MAGARVQNHRITVVADGKEVGDWTSYQLDVSMLTPADSFTLTRPFDLAAYNLLRTDRTVSVLIDQVPIVTGFIDDVEKPDGNDQIMITGRCRAGRLVDESTQRVDYQGRTLIELVSLAAGEWFEVVADSNARNRRVVRGRGQKAAVGSEPIAVETRGGSIVEPGQTRWSVIEQLLRPAGLLAWSSGDGKELIVGKPNYNQDVQFAIFHPAEASRRGADGNAMGVGIKTSTGDRYSKITVLGTRDGNATNYGRSVTGVRAEAKDNPLTANGDGSAFSAPKRLVLVEDVRNAAEAAEVAKREMARRAMAGFVVTARMPGHGQRYGGSPHYTLFAPDTMARFEDEQTQTAGLYLIAACSFTGSRASAETQLHLVPRGTEIYP